MPELPAPQPRGLIIPFRAADRHAGRDGRQAALVGHGRRQRRETHDAVALEQLAGHDDASAASEREQEASRLHAAIAGLPPGQREAVEQMGLKENSLAEAASETGRNTGALKVNLHRALKALRGRLHGDP